MNKNYFVKQIDENTWAIIDEDENVITTISKDTIINYCKDGIGDIDINGICAEELTDSIWWSVNYDYCLDNVDHYCQGWDKFTAWLDYLCVEYLAQEVVSLYKQRLLNFE
jgi:hypothetical protein